jgi:hypothetical protein
VSEPGASARKDAFAPANRARRGRRINISGIIFRSAFIVAFGLGALWASLPADRDVSTIARLPTADLLRVALGAIVCVGAFVQAFNLPKDDQAYTTWTYIGAACTITLLCVVAVRAVL